MFGKVIIRLIGVKGKGLWVTENDYNNPIERVKVNVSRKSKKCKDCVRTLSRKKSYGYKQKRSTAK